MIVEMRLIVLSGLLEAIETSWWIEAIILRRNLVSEPQGSV
jgi:hypothetical protein